MIEEADLHNSNQIELLSPTSVCDVTDLKLAFNSPEKLIPVDDHIEAQLRMSKIICVTSVEGELIYTNFPIHPKKALITIVMDLKSKRIQEALEIAKHPNFDPNIGNKILIHSHICIATIQKVRRPLLLNLQLVSETNSDCVDKKYYLIWTFKKLSISPATEESEITFSMDDYSDEKFALDRLNLMFAIDRHGTIVEAPFGLISIFAGNQNDLHPKSIHDLIDSFSELLLIMNSYSEIDVNNKRLSFSALDLDIKTHNDFTCIYSSKERVLIGNSCIMEVRLYSPFLSNKHGILFPLILKYSSRIAKLETDIQPNNSDFDSIDRFKIHKKLSESHNSIIYQVIDPLVPNTQYLLKAIKVRDFMETEPVEIKFYNYYSNDQKFCEFIEKPQKLFSSCSPMILMSYNPDYVDLFTYISTNPPLCDETVIKIFAQVVKAVEYLHDKGIIHRDIKEENVLIDTRSLSVRLIDFGSVLFRGDNQDQSSTYVGTLSHAPLEVLKGSLFESPAQDVWCLGIVLYALCFKDIPFHTPKETFEGIIKLPFKRSDAIIKLIRSILEPKPEARPTIKEILQNDIFNKL